jgi:hypothetical protein
MAFEQEFSAGPLALDGQMTTLEVADDIFRKNEDWDLTLKWSVWGDALDENSAIGLRDGDWIAHAHLESIGKGADEYDLGPVEVSKDTFIAPAVPVHSNEREYEATFKIKANDLDAGLYRIAATVTYELEGPDPRTPARMAGFIEGKMVQIYEAPEP